MIVTCPLCATRFLIDPRALGIAGRSVRCTHCNHVWMQLPAEDAPRRVDLPLPGLDRPPPRTVAPPQVVAPPPVVTPSPPRAEPAPPSIYAPPPVMPPPTYAPLPSRFAGAPAALLEDEPMRAAPPPTPAPPTPAPPMPAPPMPPQAAPPARRLPDPVRIAAQDDENVVPGSNRPLIAVAAIAAILAVLWYGRDFLMDRIPALETAYAAIGLGPGDPRDDLEVRGLRSKRTQLDGRPVLLIDGEVANISSLARRVPPLRITLEDSGRHALRSWTVVATSDRLAPGNTVPFHASVADPGGTAVGASVSFDDGNN